MLKGMWYGTKNLISRSKFGQMPRLLIKIDYKKDVNGFFIGDLEKRISIQNVDNEYKIRNVSDFILDINNLLFDIQKNKQKIESVSYAIDESLKINSNIPDDWNKLNF